GEQSFLPVDIEIRQQDMTAVAQQLFVVHGARPPVTRSRPPQSFQVQISLKPPRVNNVRTAGPCSAPCSNNNQPCGSRKFRAYSIMAAIAPNPCSCATKARRGSK